MHNHIPKDVGICEERFCSARYFAARSSISPYSRPSLHDPLNRWERVCFTFLPAYRQFFQRPRKHYQVCRQLYLIYYRPWCPGPRDWSPNRPPRTSRSSSIGRRRPAARLS
jgi:hypothetical protein